MRSFITAALLGLFSINGVASAAENDIFEIKAEGSYRNDAFDGLFIICHR